MSEMEFERVWGEPAPGVDLEQVALQGLLLLPFAIAWAIHRFRPFAGWVAVRARWHRARLPTPATAELLRQASRSARFRLFPVGLLGMASTRRTLRGTF